MSVALYMDVHVPKAITVGLRLRDVDVLTAQEDGTTTFSDTELLDRSSGLQRPIFTFDSDFLIEASNRQARGIEFAGVIYARPLRVSASECISNLEILAKAGTQEDFVNRVFFLPL